MQFQAFFVSIVLFPSRLSSGISYIELGLQLENQPNSKCSFLDLRLVEI